MTEKPDSIVQSIFNSLPSILNPAYPRWFQLVTLLVIAGGLFVVGGAIFFTWAQRVKNSKPPEIETVGVKYSPSPAPDKSASVARAQSRGGPMALPGTPSWPLAVGNPYGSDEKRLFAWVSCIHTDDSDTAYVTLQNKTDAQQVIVEIIADVSSFRELQHSQSFVLADVATIDLPTLPKQGRVSVELKRPIVIPQRHTLQFAVRLHCPGGIYEFTLTFRSITGASVTTGKLAAG